MKNESNAPGPGSRAKFVGGAPHFSEGCQKISAKQKNSRQFGLFTTT